MDAAAAAVAASLGHEGDDGVVNVMLWGICKWGRGVREA